MHRPSSTNAKPISACLQQSKGMAMKLLSYLAVALCWTPDLASGADAHFEKTVPSNPYEVTGTLSELDLPNKKGLLRTDEGKPIYLEIKKPEVFQNLSIGDRLTLHFKGDGQVDKVMGLPVPELGITGQPVPQP
jgi:hypothetical protein